MFTTGAKIDLQKLEAEIRKEIEEKKNRFFTDDELDEIQKAKLDIIANPDRVRPFFLEQIEKDSQFYKTDYNIDLNTFVYSANSRLLMKLRAWLRPFFRLYGNIDALIHKQAMLNREQAKFAAQSLRLINYLVAELTRLNLQHQLLKGQVEALNSDLDQMRKRERLLEKMAVLKEPAQQKPQE